MKDYYKAPVRRASATNFTVENNKLKYERKNQIVENNVIFYYNCFNVLVRNDTKFPVIVEDEVDDTIANDFYFTETIPSEIKIHFVDPSELKKIDYKIEEEKPKRKIKIFSRNK